MITAWIGIDNLHACQLPLVVGDLTKYVFVYTLKSGQDRHFTNKQLNALIFSFDLVTIP